MEWNFLQKLIECYALWKYVSLVSLWQGWIYPLYIFDSLMFPDLSLTYFIQILYANINII
jgi:hypothetical protein